MIKRTVEQVVMYNAIRYQTLNRLVHDKYSNSKYNNCSEINLFIDITKICNSLTKEIINFGYNEDPFSISAAILNLCAHYRSFFRRGLSVDTNIYLLYSDGSFPYNKSNYPQYSMGKYQCENIVMENIDVLNIICPYIQNIQLIQTQHEISIPINDILDFNGKRIPSILITTDIVNWQIVNRSLFGYDVCVFNPKKYGGDDLSYIVDSDNLISRYLQKRKVKRELNSFSFSSCLYTLLLAMSRVPERNMYGILSIPEATKKIEFAISNNLILNGFINISALDYLDFGKNSFAISQRYKAIELFSQYGFFRTNNIVGRYNGMINLLDPKGIQEIDNKYYQNCKVDFPSLL